MGQIRKSLKIIEKSEEEIDSLKAAVEALNLSDDEKETIIYGFIKTSNVYQQVATQPVIITLYI